MKTLKIGFTAAFMFCAALSFGQTVDKTTSQPKVNKGYYSIGDNASKLKYSAQQFEQTTTAPLPNKGYYAVKGKKSRVAKAYSYTNTGARPAVTKGYYSIGNNSQKLKR